MLVAPLCAALVLGAAALAAPRAVAASPRTGWTISIATPTSSTPDWAYPFGSGDVETPSNVEGFEQLMYRPLYYFGAGPTVGLDRALSLAGPPVYAKGDTQVSFSMRPGLRWSNGSTVDAADVVQWLNLDAAYPSAWADYLAPLPSGQPLGLPDDLRAVAVSGARVTLTLSGPVDPTWFTYSELSQITPLPGAWDLYEPSHPHLQASGPNSLAGNGGHFTGSTASGGCDATHWIGTGTTGPSSVFLDPMGTKTVVTAANVAQAQRCVDVVELMRSASADTQHYTAAGTDTARLFSLSDGPWRLLTYSLATGSITFAPNLAAGASGARPAATRLDLVPCGSNTACLALLSSGRVDQGALPIAEAPSTPSLADAPAHNPLAKDGYREAVAAGWTTTFMPYNFLSQKGAGGRAGKVFQQLYFRQGFQSLVDQSRWIATALDGYGVLTDSPIPSDPPSAFSHVRTNPYPHSLARAAMLLRTHGWHVAPGKLTTCATPKLCGPGIAKGTPLAFTIEFAPSSTALTAELRALVKAAVTVGIELTLRHATPTQVLDDVSVPNPGWDLASWDGGWRYAPDYYPSGEWLFASGSTWNVGSYADPEATKLVLATLTQPNVLTEYETYVADQLPVVWLPSPVQLVETRASLRDVQLSPLGSLTPETWRP